MATLIPEVGRIVQGTAIGYHYSNKFIGHACVDCGKVRWVMLRPNGVPAHTRCQHCASLDHRNHWKTGRVNDHGYIDIHIDKSDFFYEMANHAGYIPEHRLVMAKFLGRNLHSWEIVHHKNHIRDDNRIENLQLVSDDRHKQITILESRIARLEKRVTMLEAENILLKQEVKV